MATTQTMGRTINEAFDDLREQASGAAGEARRDFARTVGAFPYAVLGVFSINAQRTRNAVKALSELPSRALDRARHAPERIREGYYERVEAGEELVDRVRGRKSVRQARKRTRRAGKATRRAATTTARAVADAADAVNPNDNRPYEERTVEELYELASERNIEGRSQMNKRQLIQALRAER